MPRPKLDKPNFRLRRAANGKWYIDYTIPGGRPKSVSTGTKDERAARQALAEFDAGWSKPEPQRGATIAEILDGYLADRKGHVRDYDRLDFAGRALKRHLGELQIGHLSKRLYLQRRRREKVGDGTILKEVVTLRSALKWAEREKWIDKAPHIEGPPKPAPRERFLSRDEADALVRACRAPHVRLFMLCALHTAGRKGAILDLQWDRVDLEARVIHLRRPGRAQTKKRRATVPINNTLLTALQEAQLIAVTDHVIEYKGKPVKSVRHAFERAVERAGIEYCTRHDLRRTAASWMVMAGIPLKQVAAMLGDTEAMVEKVYGRFSPDWLRDAARALEGDTAPRIVERRVG